MKIPSKSELDVFQRITRTAQEALGERGEEWDEEFAKLETLLTQLEQFDGKCARPGRVYEEFDAWPAAEAFGDVRKGLLQLLVRAVMNRHGFPEGTSLSIGFGKNPRFRIPSKGKQKGQLLFDIQIAVTKTTE